jgi:hypothetical protein
MLLDNNLVKVSRVFFDFLKAVELNRLVPALDSAF